MSKEAKRLILLWVAVVLACFGVALIASHAHATDVPPPAKAAITFQYPLKNGWVIGLGTEGGAGSAQFPAATVIGVNANSVTTTTIDAHLLVGYVWTMPNSPMFASVEGRIGWQNFNGSSPGFALSGPLAFEQRLVFGAPTDVIMSVLPNLLGNVTPPPFVTPPGQTVTATKWYIGVTLDQRDISLSFPGEGPNKVWAIAPGIVPVGTKNLLSGGTAIDTYLKIRFDDKGVCAGPTSGIGCAKLGTSYLAGVNLEWGL